MRRALGRETAMNVTAKVNVREDGMPEIFLEGLRVWVRESESGDQWIANGIDIDYATSGETQELAVKAFVFGLCLTMVEHQKRFNSLEKLLSRRAPDDIYKAWMREVEMNRLDHRVSRFQLPEAEFGDNAPHRLIPHALRVYEPRAVHA